MKQCPVCNEQFDDEELFCDQDGANLLDQTDSLRDALNHAQPKQASSAWITGAIGGFIGVIICVLLYLLFLAPSKQDLDIQDRRSSQTQQTAPVRSTQLMAAPAPQPTPAVETESPSPEAEAAASPSPVAAPPAAALNNGPIATGTKEARTSERAIIKMRDGSSVEADAAWEDAQGVWYRRSGLVSFVEKSRVEAITDLPQRQPAKPEVKAP